MKGHGGKALVDLVAMVRHVFEPERPLVPIEMTVQERYIQWLSECESRGLIFTNEQRQWLDAIRDHIAQSLHIEQQDFEEVPFSQMGGLGKVYQVFGEKLKAILKELNERLVA